VQRFGEDGAADLSAVRVAFLSWVYNIPKLGCRKLLFNAAAAAATDGEVIFTTDIWPWPEAVLGHATRVGAWG